MKKIVIALISILVIFVIASFVLPKEIAVKNNSTTIPYTETFTQKDDDYLVYFYQDDCTICEKFSPELVKTTKEKNIPLYLVDLGDEENKDAWYDWATHYDTYEKEIGIVVDGEKQFFVGESEDKYPTEDGWEIVVTEENEVYATKPNAINNKNPQNADELDVAGTPTLIRITNASLNSYGEGLTECREILSNF